MGKESSGGFRGDQKVKKILRAEERK